MAYRPHTAELRFVLDHVAGIAALTGPGASEPPALDLVEAVLEGAGAFAAGEWAPLARTGDREGARWTAEGVRMPPGYVEAYRAYVEGGWGTIGVAEAWGGQGLPFALHAAVIETLGTADLAFSLCPTLTGGAIEAIAHHGSDAQQATYLPHLATGDWTGTMNLTEPQAGSDVGALRTTATPAGDGRWRIKGTKIFISYGDHDLAPNIVHLVLARTPDAPAGTRGISLFLVPKYRLDADGAPGAYNDVRVVSIEHKMGLHASPTCVLSYGDADDCYGELIGPEHGGMRAMFTMMNNARLLVGLQGVQVAEAATQDAIAYALERVQSARAGAAAREAVAIVDHADVRRMLLRMRAQTMAARTLVYAAAREVDRARAEEPGAQERLDLLTPLAKSHATDLAVEVASLGIQVHGGTGFIEETGVARHYRDARILPIYEGTNGIQAADLVGRKLGLAGGTAYAELIAAMRGEAAAPALRALIDACDRTAAWLSAASHDDRAAGSVPFQTMLSVAVAGWLIERQGRAADGDDGFAAVKRAGCAFYLERIVPEALGLEAGATAGAATLYAVEAAAFAA